MAEVEVERGGLGWLARVDGQPAGELVAREGSDGSVVLVHTEVSEELGGHGVGAALVRAAVDALAAEGRTVRPACPFAASWLERHPEHPVQVVHRRRDA